MSDFKNVVAVTPVDFVMKSSFISHKKITGAVINYFLFKEIIIFF